LRQIAGLAHRRRREDLSELAPSDDDKEGRSVIAFALGELRKRKLATEIADLAVCGAIPPYNHLIGGKLIALLMASQDARILYAQRYEQQESEIASQMAGRAVVRPANLRVITTTSLYGLLSNQYNRLKVTVKERGKNQQIAWQYLGQTKGITVTHLSRRTVELMRSLVLTTMVLVELIACLGFESTNSPNTRRSQLNWRQQRWSSETECWPPSLCM